MTIMRRSSSKKRSERAAAAAANITELDDTALEKQISDVADADADEVVAGGGADGMSGLPSARVCESASLRSANDFARVPAGESLRKRIK